MDEPVVAKRHHWWPMAQSRFWTAQDGLVTVTRADGTNFRANPLNLGVESELYTRFLDDDTKDAAIEDWFAETIDGPTTALLEHLLDPVNVTRHPFRGNPRKAETARALGFRVTGYVDRIALPPKIRRAIAVYIAALLVRHPSYIAKLTDFHRADAPNEKMAKNRALDNMIHVFNVYSERINTAYLAVSRRVGSFEYLYTDGGLKVEEPWQTRSGVPFDIHAPLTPDISLAVLPIPLPSQDFLRAAAIAEATDAGVSRQNRIVLGSARRFVFSRSTPPTSFITRYFGRPAPKSIGYTVREGRLQTWYEPERDEG